MRFRLRSAGKLTKDVKGTACGTMLQGMEDTGIRMPVRPSCAGEALSAGTTMETSGSVDSSALPGRNRLHPAQRSGAGSAPVTLFSSNSSSYTLRVRSPMALHE